LSTGLLFIPLAFLAVFYFYPLLAIMRLSLAPRGTLDVQALTALIRSSYYLRTLWFTTWQAAASTALTLTVGLPAAYVFARYEFPGKTLLRALTTIPFILPTVVVAAAFTALLGPGGYLNLALMRLFHLDQPPIQLLGTIWMILLAHVFYNYTVVLRIVGSFWANLDPALEHAAAVLGANRFHRLAHITLPLLTPAVAAAALLIFIFDFTSFGVVLILGGAQFATLEVEIYRQTVNLFNLPIAAALSLIQILCTLAMTVAYTRLQARTARPLNLRPQSITQRKPVTLRARMLVGFNVTLMAALLITPLLALVLRSLTEGTQPLAELFVNRRGSYFYVPPIVAIRNSLLIATVTVIASLSLGFMAAHSLTRRAAWWAAILDPVFMSRVHAAAGHVGGDAGLGLPHRVGRASVGFARVARAAAAGAHARRVSVRRAIAAAGLARHSPLAARGCRRDGRLALADLASGGLAHRRARDAGCGCVRVCHLDGRVWRDGARGPARISHDAGRHLSLSGSARRVELRSGAGDEHDADARVRGGHCADRAGASGGSGRVLTEGVRRAIMVYDERQS